MVKDTKLYDILEVETDATEIQIKKSYNKLSKIWHPDKHQDPEKKKEATIKFQEINQAKNILIDEEKRKIYNQVGMDMLKHNTEGSGSDHNPFSDFSNGFPFDMGGFPGFNGHNGKMNPDQRKNMQEHIVEHVEVSLEDIIRQKSINVNYKQKVYCSKCNGEGTKNSQEAECKVCDGNGKQIRVIRRGNMIQQMIVECPHCKGIGIFIEEENKCNECIGKGFTIKDKSIQVPLNSGVLFGQDAVFEGKGHQLKKFKSNLIIKIHELPHKIFKRLEDDLYMDMEIQLYQALFGFDKVLNHLDGRKLHISCSSKTEFNKIRKINGEGIANPIGVKGNLYIRFIVNLPNFNTLSPDTKTQLKVLLESFDKTEVLNETTVKSSSSLVKTICSDLKPEQSEQVSHLINKLKISKSENNSRNHNKYENEEGHHQSQCAQS